MPVVLLTDASHLWHAATVLAQRVEDLKRVLAEPEHSEFPELYDQALEQVEELRDPLSIEALMTLIDDDADHLITFGLVHTIERFDDPVYLEHWLAGLPQLRQRSPEWAQILLLRILNSPSASAELLERAPLLSGSQRDSLREVATSLVASRAEFADRGNAVLVELA